MVLSKELVTWRPFIKTLEEEDFERLEPILEESNKLLESESSNNLSHGKELLDYGLLVSKY